MAIIEEVEDTEHSQYANQDASMVNVVSVPDAAAYEDPSDDDIDDLDLPQQPQTQQQQPQEAAKSNSKLEDGLTAEQRRELRKMQMIYPCYFDKNRTTQQGRRLPLSACVENPLAYTIFQACRDLRIVAVFDGDKSHPQDWGNPGRVRIGCKWDGTPTHDQYKSKKQMMHAIADYLQKHPTTLANVKDLPGAPEYMEGEYKPQQVPKVLGFHMNTIVPLHSKLTMKNPNTAGVYIKPKNQEAAGEKVAKQKKMKMKVKRIRG